jgi:hypothetical protein
MQLEMPGVVDYLSTEISTSKQKKFPLVTFVDSPGLVDGDMRYSSWLVLIFHKNCDRLLNCFVLQLQFVSRYTRKSH